MLVLSGCGQRGLKGLVPAEGMVTLNGEPVEGASISFAPQSGVPDARSAAAMTDKNGKFVATIFNYGDGMQPGEYQVFVTKTTGTGGESSPEDKNRRGTDDRRVVNHLPPKYNEKTTSGLTVSIPPAGNKNIELKLEGEVDLTPQRLTER